MNDKLKTICLVGITLSIIIGIGFYGFGKYTYYQKQQIEIDLKKKENEKSEKRQINLEKCLATAQENYKSIWDNTCSNGIGDWINICQGEQGENCNQCILSDEQADRLNLLLEKDKNECFKKYQ